MAVVFFKSASSVCNLSKNTIWKQITTHVVTQTIEQHLYAIYQRTQSESKSQLSLARLCGKLSVCNLSKNTIWKQITTGSLLSSQFITLYAIYQRTQSESKSQPFAIKHCAKCFCMQSIKEHNLKANHNSFSLSEAICNLYAIYQRTQSESKSQHERWFVRPLHFCMQSIKEHNLKANHNIELIIFALDLSVCNLSKNTIWKQITTSLAAYR